MATSITQIRFYLSIFDTDTLVKHLSLYKRAYWVNLKDVITAEAHGVIDLACFPKLISHVCMFALQISQNLITSN